MNRQSLHQRKRFRGSNTNIETFHPPPTIQYEDDNFYNRNGSVILNERVDYRIDDNDRNNLPPQAEWEYNNRRLPPPSQQYTRRDGGIDDYYGSSMAAPPSSLIRRDYHHQHYLEGIPQHHSISPRDRFEIQDVDDTRIYPRESRPYAAPPQASHYNDWRLDKYAPSPSSSSSSLDLKQPQPSLSISSSDDIIDEYGGGPSYPPSSSSSARYSNQQQQLGGYSNEPPLSSTRWINNEISPRYTSDIATTVDETKYPSFPTQRQQPHYHHHPQRQMTATRPSQSPHRERVPVMDIKGGREEGDADNNVQPSSSFFPTTATGNSHFRGKRKSGRWNNNIESNSSYRYDNMHDDQKQDVGADVMHYEGESGSAYEHPSSYSSSSAPPSPPYAVTQQASSEIISMNTNTNDDNKFYTNGNAYSNGTAVAKASISQQSVASSNNKRKLMTATPRQGTPTTPLSPLDMSSNNNNNANTIVNSTPEMQTSMNGVRLKSSAKSITTGAASKMVELKASSSEIVTDENDETADPKLQSMIQLEMAMISYHIAMARLKLQLHHPPRPPPVTVAVTESATSTNLQGSNKVKRAVKKSDDNLAANSDKNVSSNSKGEIKQQQQQHATKNGIKIKNVSKQQSSPTKSIKSPNKVTSNTATSTSTSSSAASTTGISKTKIEGGLKIKVKQQQNVSSVNRNANTNGANRNGSADIAINSTTNSNISSVLNINNKVVAANATAIYNNNNNEDDDDVDMEIDTPPLPSNSTTISNTAHQHQQQLHNASKPPPPQQRRSSSSSSSQKSSSTGIHYNNTITVSSSAASVAGVGDNNSSSYNNGYKDFYSDSNADVDFSSQTQTNSMSYRQPPPPPRDVYNSSNGSSGNINYARGSSGVDRGVDIDSRITTDNYYQQRQQQQQEPSSSQSVAYNSYRNQSHHQPQQHYPLPPTSQSYPSRYTTSTAPASAIVGGSSYKPQPLSTLSWNQQQQQQSYSYAPPQSHHQQQQQYLSPRYNTSITATNTINTAINNSNINGINGGGYHKPYPPQIARPPKR